MGHLMVSCISCNKNAKPQNLIAKGKTQRRGPFGELFPFGNPIALMFFKSEQELQKHQVFYDLKKVLSRDVLSTPGKDLVQSTQATNAGARVMNPSVTACKKRNLRETKSQAKPFTIA